MGEVRPSRVPYSKPTSAFSAEIALCATLRALVETHALDRQDFVAGNVRRIEITRNINGIATPTLSFTAVRAIVFVERVGMFGVEL